MNIHGDNVTFVVYKTLLFNNFVKNDQLAAKLDIRFLLHKINKKLPKKGYNMG